ncbi:TonB-dependent receptor plug domain-containing protein [Novosphingobium piscinae]|uniref:TonB-dependent receptor n=1 Tax=Novosphingobium piscinae TaxID=1507448 RepID=A0A7X1KNG7_9SPHN|nr:TonB-dependent receptor [Novosphingobium piscinae]MBC2667617.1 TonB-dependent receptor [Novosphingobium piscinae]
MIGLVVAGWSLAAAAQQAPASAAEDEATQDIIVTGTAIKGVAPVGSATVTLDRTSMVQSGIRDTSQLIALLPQGSNLGTSQNSTGGRQQGVNLRGLGNNATLLLFDGHRWVPQGVVDQISDPTIIPFAAIERIEVVTDGASAIYGSDAVAGVVNYILRKDYEGAEVTARLNSTLYNQYTIEGVVGHKWDTGGLMVGFSYLDRNRVKRNERPYLLQDLRPYGGNDNRLVGTSVTPAAGGALIIGTSVYGLPVTNGAKPTAAQAVLLNPALAASNPALYNSFLFDTGNFYDYFASRQQLSALLKAHQEFGDAVEAKLTVNYNRRQGSARATEALQNIAVRLTPSSPFYISGLPNPTANQTYVYNLGLNFANDRELTQRNKEDTFNSTFELSAKVFSGFSLDSFVSYGVSTGCNVCQAQANTTIAANIANPGLTGYNAGFNPYVGGAQSAAEMLIAGFLQEGVFRTLDAGTKLSGALFDLPGGSAKIAVGGEYMQTWFSLKAQNKLNFTNTFQISRNTDSGRKVKSLYAEVFVPIFGSSNATTLFDQLDLSAAVRYDDYSDFIRSYLAAGAPKTLTTAHSLNPKFGLTWQPTQGVKIRASWGSSFRMPTLIENNPATIGQTNRVFIPNGVTTIPVTNVATGQTLVLNRTGNTPGLRPETAKIWSLGADFAPDFAPDLRFGVTYYNVDYKDRIENLPNQTAATALVISSPTNQALFKDYFIVAPQPSTCVNGNFSTYNPAYLPFLNDPNAVFTPFTTNDCQLEGIVNGGRQNLGRVKQSGLDFTLNWKHETPVGTFTFDGSFSKILNLQKSLTRSGPLFDALDTFGFQVSGRGRGQIGYANGGLHAALAANYVGSYLNNATITVAGVRLPDTRIPAWTTLDANLAYDFDDDSPILGGTRIALTVQNLGNKAPPIVLSGTNAIDTNNHNVWGRIWTFEVTKRF